MAVLFTSWWSEFFFVASCLLLVYYVYFVLVVSKVWKKYNVPHEEPVFLLGNTWRGFILENLNFTFSRFHRKWKDQKLVGIWNFGTPNLLITDLDLIKNVLTKDFSHFRDRGLIVDFDHDPLAGNLFNLVGAKWRNLRVKLTPTFTSGKMKMMFPTMAECGENMQQFLSKVAIEKKEVDVKEILARFTTDIIASCAFGIKTNSLENPDSEFRVYGRKLTTPTFDNLFRGLLLNMNPKLLRAFKIHLLPKDVSEFFINAVKETIESREKNNIRRNDFLQLLIELKNKGKLEDVDWIPNGLGDDEKGDLPLEDMKFTLLEAAAQAFVFFVAGFETSSTAMSFALYELALNADVQASLHEEIDSVLEKHGGKLTYEAVSEMDLLDRVVQETLRKYPPAPILLRQCNKDYEIPELNATIPKKTAIVISVMGLHMDPETFPNPLKFDPARFSPEEKEKRHPYAYIPFGEGPRMCIGNRFALLQTKVGLVSFLSKHRVDVSSSTPIPVKYVKNFFILASDSGMHLRVSDRETSSRG